MDDEEAVGAHDVDPIPSSRWTADARALAVVIVAALALFAHAYAVNEHRPGATSTLGWLGWADQLNYVGEARALADGELPGIRWDYDTMTPRAGWEPGDPPIPDYAYGLGYPLLGVPGLWLDIDSDPFLPVDAALWALVVGGTAALGFRLRGTWFGLTAAGLLAVASPLLELFVTPWNNVVTVAAVVVALLVATDPRPSILRAGVPLGLAVGVCFAARYLDAVFPAVIGGVPLLLRGRSLRAPAWKALAVAAGLALVAAVPVLWSHERVFGSPFTTPYAHHTDAEGQADQGFGAYDLAQVPRTFVEVFVTAAVDGQRVVGEPLLRLFPLAVLAPVGLIALHRRRAQWRFELSLGAAVSVVATIMYLSFSSGTGNELQYSNIRYFAPWFPLWTLLACEAMWWTSERVGNRPTEVSDGVRTLG